MPSEVPSASRQAKARTTNVRSAGFSLPPIPSDIPSAPRQAKARTTSSSLRKDLVKQEVNEDAGHADVHPDRPGPAGDLFVGLETLFEGAADRDQHQRHD